MEFLHCVPKWEFGNEGEWEFGNEGMVICGNGISALRSQIPIWEHSLEIPFPQQSHRRIKSKSLNPPGTFNTGVCAPSLSWGTRLER